MFRTACLAGLALLLATSAAADPPACRQGPCRQVFVLQSVAETRSYALLVVAPAAGCRRVRYRVETPVGRFLGHSSPLVPGEVAIVRLGSGYAAGIHDLRIVAQGCGPGPALTRRVTLQKAAPDHGWRAAS